MDAPQSEEAHEDIPEGWDIMELWKKYEEVAMHFNDLLIRLRTQALAGVAALTTLTSIFIKSPDAAMGTNWAAATIVFSGLSFFWIAIWILDFTYYNKLLIGAVFALVGIEEKSKTKRRIDNIQLSTIIENVVASSQGPYSSRNCCERFRLKIGRWAFYVVVFLPLITGALFSLWKYSSST